MVCIKRARLRAFWPWLLVSLCRFGGLTAIVVRINEEYQLLDFEGSGEYSDDEWKDDKPGILCLFVAHAVVELRRWDRIAQRLKACSSISNDVKCLWYTIEFITMIF